MRQAVDGIRRAARHRVAWLALCCAAWAPAGEAAYVQDNLVSDGAVPAAFTDPQLVNPWGLSQGPGTAIWVSDQASGVSTLYTGTGSAIPLVVTIPNPAGSGPSGPTGQVFNGSGDFVIAQGDVSRPSRFLFATEQGSIAGWNRDVDATHAITKVDLSATGASYTGLAIAQVGGASRLFAANFGGGNVQVFDAGFNLVQSFTDAGLPLDYAPFNVQVVGDRLYVNYAKRNDEGEEVPGAGNGYLDVFDLNGVLLQRLVSNGALNAPWAVALAPAGFGTFANALLVGNFGDGRINAFDPATGLFLGALFDSTHAPIEIEGLWGLLFGTGGAGTDPNTLYFAAGIDDEAHGLFGSLRFVPAPATPWLVALGLLLLVRRAGRPRG